MQTIQDTIAAQQEAVAYGATPVEFKHTDFVVEALGTDWASGAVASTHGYGNPIFALQIHGAVMQGRLNWARWQRDLARRTEEKIAALQAAGDPHNQIPALQTQLATRVAAAKKTYGELLYGLQAAEQLDFWPAIQG